MDLSNFETNPDISQAGVWCEIGDAQLKIARYGNKKFQKLLQRLMAPYKRLSDQGQLSDEIAEKIMIEALAKCVLLDWKGLTDNGIEIEYSLEKAKEILSDPRYKDFREVVVSMSQEADLFRKEEVEEVVGKSQDT